jgi:hypothetical protein
VPNRTINETGDCMMLKSIAIATLLFSTGAIADNKTTSMSVEEFQQTHVSQNCGYWIEREIEVCDERVVYDNEAYKQCNYNRTSTTNPSMFPTTYSISMAVNAQCYNDKTLGVPGYTPHAVYALSGEEIKYRQVSRTERYNCRIETRMVWVPGNPRTCGNPDY